MRNLTKQLISNIETTKAQTTKKRNLILSILKSTATKRETKHYLDKYQNQFSRDNTKNFQSNIFVNRFLQSKKPFRNIYDINNNKIDRIPLRIAVCKLEFKSVSPEYWDGIQETFKRLVDLGVSPIIIMDYDLSTNIDFKHNESIISKYGDNILKALKDVNPMLIRNLFSNDGDHLEINNLHQLLMPMYQNFIPIIQPLVTDVRSSQQYVGDTNDILTSTCQELITTQDLLSIEKIILISGIGGIPSIERNHASHVFINLSQEYSDLVSELYIGFLEPPIRDLHIKNLQLINNILTMVNSHTGSDEATGIITTPFITSINDDQLNPLIYNVLTDRPIISSSLPLSFNRTPRLSTSILKKGVEVKVLEPRNYNKSFTFANLVKDQMIDKHKLITLINDSFGKQLDVDAYIQRINNSLATIIIVGDYDGGAIITKETWNNQQVTYLDKFAVAKKYQGLPGLADIIFKLIIQSNPEELIWRSRKNNPVNKWYFERSLGSISKTDSRWKLFYTGDVFNKDTNTKQKKGQVNINAKLKLYWNICQNIPPSFISIPTSSANIPTNPLQ